ncbi:MAG: hypothetical protein A49_03670 [Methyloceanibacter sp.]|nr:MAG: hypothetical protein A49_03670 [Methyloceanibacter sp.]
MVSHYLRDNPQTRPLSEVMHDILANTAEAYFVVSFSRDGKPIVEEALFGVSRAKIVRDLADGQFDHNIRDRDSDRLLGVDTPYAVYRIRPRAKTFEIVTREIAEAVARYIIDTDYFPNEWRDCPFLNVVWPNWRDEQGVAAA